MKHVLSSIKHQQEKLSQTPLFLWLKDDTIDGYERLSFSPSMMYYLMGFKDVLSALHRPHPKTDIDTHINAYCDEDAEHWRWYLSDLQKLGYTLSSWGQSIPTFCNAVWSPETEINRQTIFKLVNYANSSSDPLLAVTLIMVFEATGVVFIGHTLKAATSIGMDETLKYFGRRHYEEEFGHSVKSSEFEQYHLPVNVQKSFISIVEDLFFHYTKLFQCWYDCQHLFTHKQICDTY